MRYHYWKPYVPVAKRRAQAAKKAANFEKSGRKLCPVSIEGRTIARTFWGKAWCDHVESFSDYANRLPRGRTYARNGSIIDLQIAKGTISALVMGSELYEIRFTIQPLEKSRWASIKDRSIGQIDSLVELLQGRFSDAVMRGITDRQHGLFPAAAEIKKTCSCPDSAGLCKHLAAALYGIGARLDEKPELLFLLRGVDHLELLEGAPAAGGDTGPSDLDGDDLGDVFGIEIAAPAAKKPKKASSPIKPPEKPKLDKKRRIPQRAGGTPVVPEKLTALAPSRVEPKKKLARKKAAAPKPPAKLAAKPSAKPLAKDLLKAKARARRRRRLAKMKSPGASPAAIGGTGSVRSVANHGGRPSSNKASFGGSDPMGVKKL